MENFELMAANYDTESRIRRANQIAAKLREYIIDAQDKRALEYGCGTGLVGLQLAELFASLLLVDSSPAMIEQLNHKLNASPLPQVSVLHTDFLKAALPDTQVDYIFTSLVMHHVEDVEAILRRFYELLNSGGRLLIVDLEDDGSNYTLGRPGYEDYHGFNLKEFSALIRKVGFISVECEVFLHDAKHIEGREYPYSVFILEAQK